jgi:hypothetical protein
MKKIIFSLVMLAMVFPFQARAVMYPVSPIGSNIVNPSGTVYRVLGEDGNKTMYPYSSAGAFLSYKFNTWAGVKKATDADLTWPIGTSIISPRPGSLINDGGTVYLILKSQKIGFASAKVFTDLGYSFSNVYPGDTSFLENAATVSTSARQHDAGTLVNFSGTLYILSAECRLGIPNMSVLNSWGYWPQEAVKANTFDSAYSTGGTLQLRQDNQLNVLDTTTANCGA